MPLVWGYILTKQQPHQQADHMLCWPAVAWLWTTRCMYWGGGIEGWQGCHGGIGGLHMNNYDSVFQSILEKSKQYLADNWTWAQVNQTSVSTTLGHQVHLPLGGYIWQLITLTISWWYVMLTCSSTTLDH